MSFFSNNSEIQKVSKRANKSVVDVVKVKKNFGVSYEAATGDFLFSLNSTTYFTAETLYYMENYL